MRCACARDAAAHVQVGGLERPDHAPAPAQAVADDAVDVCDRRDAVAHERVRLAQHRALQPVEHEALELDAHPYRGEPGALEQRMRPLDHVLGREGRRNDLDDRQEVGGIPGMHDEAARAARELGCHRRRGDRRRRAREDRLGRRHGIELCPGAAASARRLSGAHSCTYAAPATAAPRSRSRGNARAGSRPAARRAGRTTRGRRAAPRCRAWRERAAAASRSCSATSRPPRLSATAQPMPIVPAPTMATTVSGWPWGCIGLATGGIS